MSESKDTTKKKDNNKIKNIITTIILVVISVAFGYFLGSHFSLDFSDNNSKWAGTYTTEKWKGRVRATLELKKDGTCKRPDQNAEKCTYEVKDGKVYFNGEMSSDTAIGQDGLVYHNTRFEKLK